MIAGDSGTEGGFDAIGYEQAPDHREHTQKDGECKVLGFQTSLQDWSIIALHAPLQAVGDEPVILDGSDSALLATGQDRWTLNGNFLVVL